jgi:glutaredoxin-like protein NrdH
MVTGIAMALCALDRRVHGRRSLIVIDVYGQVGCMACKGTTRWLDDHEIEYQYHDIQHDPKALDKVMSLGYSGVPVVVTDSLHWQGFSLPNLKRLLKRD